MGLPRLAYQPREIHVEADDAGNATKGRLGDRYDARPRRSEGGFRAWRGVCLVVGPGNVACGVDQHGSVLLERVMVGGQDDQQPHLEVDALATREILAALDCCRLVLLQDDRRVLEPRDDVCPGTRLLLGPGEQLVQQRRGLRVERSALIWSAGREQEKRRLDGPIALTRIRQGRYPHGRPAGCEECHPGAANRPAAYSPPGFSLPAGIPTRRARAFR